MSAAKFARLDPLDEVLVELRDRRRLRELVSWLAALSDVGTMAVGIGLASLIWYGAPYHEQGLQTFAVMLPIFMVLALNNRLYASTSVMRARAGSAQAMMTFALTLAAVGLVTFFLKVSADFSRAVFALGAILTLPAMAFGRALLSGWARKRFGGSIASEVVLQDGVVTEREGAFIIDVRRYHLEPRLDHPAALDRLGRCVQHADRVIISCPPERRAVWASAIKGADINAEVLSPDLDTIGAIGLSHYEGSCTLVVAAAPLDAYERALKRALDLVLTLMAMPFLLPLMALVALAIKLDSPGAVFFVQDRVGLGNRIFKMYKFRSMYSDRTDHLGDRSAARSDDRVTRVGRLIRASSLDELPQLFNILKGDMSIVGPRPHPLLCKAEDRLLWDIDLRYWHRHAVKPGLTGLAQVRGFRGATEKEHHFTDRLQADLEYLSGWTVWRDMRIIFATFRVLVHRNAF